MEFREYLSEGADEASFIRDALKKQFGLTNRDVSIKSRSGSVRVSLKSVKSLPYKKKIEEIGSSKERIHRDGGGNILRGGNFFIFVEVDWQFHDKLVKKIEAEISKKVTDEFMNGEGGGNVIDVYGDYGIVKDRQSGNFWLSHPSRSWAGHQRRSIIEVAADVLSLMLQNEDEKNLKKLG